MCKGERERGHEDSKKENKDAGQQIYESWFSESERAKVITECTAIYLCRVRKMQGLTRVDVTKKKKGGEVLVINIPKAKREWQMPNRIQIDQMQLEVLERWKENMQWYNEWNGRRGILQWVNEVNVVSMEMQCMQREVIKKKERKRGNEEAGRVLMVGWHNQCFSLLRITLSTRQIHARH